MGALGAQSGAKWSQVSAKGLPGRAKVPQNKRKSTPQERSFSPEAPRRVPGRDSGPTFGGFGKYFECILNLFSMIFLLCSSSVFDIGDV